MPRKHGDDDNWREPKAPLIAHGGHPRRQRW
jgi:hypothetical protein